MSAVIVGSGLAAQGLVGLEVPVADRAAVGFATGLALGGRRPVVRFDGTHSLLAALDALAEAARVGANLVVRCECGDNAVLDRAVGASLIAVPGLRVLAASSLAHADALVDGSLDEQGPTVVLVPRAAPDTGPADAARWPVTVQDGGSGSQPARATVLTWGAGVEEVLALGLSDVAVIDLVRLAPLPAEALADRVRATGRLVIADPGLGGGDAAGQALVWAAVQEAFDWLECPPAVVAPEAVPAAIAAAIGY